MTAPTATTTAEEAVTRNAPTRRETPTGDAKFCLCGHVLTAPPRGRTPISCSATCRRRRQTLTRQRRLREAWAALWREQATAGLVAREEAATEIAALEDDIAELNLRLEPPPVTEGADR